MNGNMRATIWQWILPPACFRVALRRQNHAELLEVRVQGSLQATSAIG